MINKYLINPISNYIVRYFLQKIQKTFKRETQEEVTVTEKVLWDLLLEYRKQRSAEEYIETMVFVKYLLIKLNLRNEK